MSFRLIDDPPGVFLAGITTPNATEITAYLERRRATWIQRGEAEDNPVRIPEAAGRVCYQSWGNVKQATAEEYLQDSIIKHKHGSVLEHLWYNLLVCDLPRSVQLELVRHGEGTAFSFESQRFTDRDLRFVIPPGIRHNDDLVAKFEADCQNAYDAYQLLVETLGGLLQFSTIEDNTLRRKRIKETARAVLPNAVASDGMVSMNARAARHIIQLRTSEHADLSIREFAYELYRALKQATPAIFADGTITAVENWPPKVLFATEKV